MFLFPFFFIFRETIIKVAFVCFSAITLLICDLHLVFMCSVRGGLYVPASYIAPLCVAWQHSQSALIKIQFYTGRTNVILRHKSSMGLKTIGLSER